MSHFIQTFLRSTAVIALLVMLSACSNNSNSSRSGTTLEDFRNELLAAAGPNGRACGELAIGESEIDADSCLAEAFTNDTPAWSIVRRQGIDSTVAMGTTVRHRNVVFYDFDGDPNGGGADDNGRISTRECIEPSLSGIVGDPMNAPTFQCEGFLVTPSGTGNGQSTPDTPTQVAGTPPFVGQTWIWIGYQAVIDGPIEAIINDPASYTLEFTEENSIRGEGNVSGNVLCNSFSGSWNTGELDNVFELQIAGLFSTEIACDGEPLTGAAASYLQLLATASSYSMQGERLFIATPEGGTLFFTNRRSTGLANQEL